MAYAIIIGGGKIGYHVTRSLINANYEVLLLEKNIAIYRRLAADLGDVVMQGDGCDPLILKAAGIERADLVVAATEDDADNLVISQMASHCFGRKKIIARVNNPDNDPLYDELGIHERVSGTAAILNLVGQKVGGAPVILLGALERSNIEVVELIIDERSPLLGGRLGELTLPPQTLIISVLRRGEAMIPNADTVFEIEDVVVALIPQELESALREFVV
ncbi:MAG TPA: NAD-binding protein [Abditibacteriaceae bacterium]|nr:NAD-binding protein [Abditibacteriaceae bacterium]